MIQPNVSISEAVYIYANVLC